MAGGLEGRVDGGRRRGRLRPAPRVRDTRGSDRNVVPLINVIFLLLLFFMVAGEFATQREAKVEPPASFSDRPDPRWAPVLVLDGTGELRLDGRPVSLTNIGAVLAVDGVVAHRVGLQADAHAGGARLADVVEHLAAAGVGEVALSTRRRAAGAAR